MTQYDSDSLLIEIKRAVMNDDKSEVDRLQKEFLNVEAQKAKKNGDQIALLLCACIDEFHDRSMYGAQALFLSLCLLHKLGMLDSVCGSVLYPSIVGMMDEIAHTVRLSQLQAGE